MGGFPERGWSRRPAIPVCPKRLRHSLTVGMDAPVSCATCWISILSKQACKIRALSTVRASSLGLRLIAVNSARVSAEHSRGAACLGIAQTL